MDHPSAHWRIELCANQLCPQEHASEPAFLAPAIKRLLSMKPTVNDLASAVAALYGKPRPSPDQLLKRMLDMAQPHMAGARPLSYAQLLAGCVAAGWRPDDRWLAEHHAAAAKALRAPGAADADVLLQLLSALSAPKLAPQASSDHIYLAAREELVLEMAQRLLQEPAVRTLAAKPDLLVDAVRQVVVQGARPSEHWTQQLIALMQGLIPQLNPKGLATAAESLALLGAAPPASFLTALLAQAGKYDMASYDQAELGLLLGGVHRLKVGALSAKAQEVWGRAHAAFLPHCLAVLPTYPPAQASMVAGSVVAFQLAQPAGGLQAGQAPWLSGLLGALPQCRACGALPPPALLVDLLRLGSRVLGGREDGGIASAGSWIPDASTLTSQLLEYVQQSLSDLAASEVYTASADWPLLLRAATDAGLRLETPILQQYSASLIQPLYDMVKGGEVSREQLSSAIDALTEAIASALLPALPWVPEGSAGALLLRVLEAPALLRACSARQLALLCTYATQSGLGTQRMWERVGEEVGVRVTDLLLAGGSALDFFAVQYGLKVAGDSVAAGVQREQQGWDVGLELGLQQLQGLSSSSGEPTVPPLQALHVLWVAHRLGCLPQVAPGVWAAAHAATDDQLRLLLPYQLAQLVELRAAAAAEGLQLPPAPEGYTARVLHALLQRPNPGSGTGATSANDTQLVQGIAAVRALAYLPGQELEEGWEALVSAARLVFERPDCKYDCSASRVTGLSAADVAAWACSVERLWRTPDGSVIRVLSVQQLRGLVKVLAAPAAASEASAKAMGKHVDSWLLGDPGTIKVRCAGPSPALLLTRAIQAHASPLPWIQCQVVMNNAHFS